MKYLLLILLIACGKNSTPPVEGTIKTEADLQKEISEALMEKKLTEIIDFSVNGTLSLGKQRFAFDNTSDLQSEIYRLAVSSWPAQATNRLMKKSQELKIHFGNQFENLKSVEEITFKFNSGLKPDSLVVIEGNKSEPFHQLLSSETALKLFNGTAKLSMNQSMPSLEEYSRTFVFDGTKTQVFFVPRGMSKTIENSRNLDDVQLEMATGTEREWYMKKLPGNDVVFINSSLNDLSKAFYNEFDKAKFQIRRSNGTGQFHQITKNTGSRMFLRVSGSRAFNAFKEWTEDSINIVSVTRYFRSVSALPSQSLAQNDILENLAMTVDGKTYLPKLVATPDGKEFLISIPANSGVIALVVSDFPGARKAVGIYDAIIGGVPVTDRPGNKLPGYSPENYFELNFEALVEKAAE